ncbi:hypothetical protein EOD39_18401 [Acipenser ruthenus]|uniref:Uncharacterized protein n=1 Tax=Acipenser ruthenus TaxID=7906 RepID=A0A444V0Z4_ACIRT|nr:hypothetical protein EOD39_18401 [Acipenser ruthenus]
MGSFVVAALHGGEALQEGKCSPEATSPEKDGVVRELDEGPQHPPVAKNSNLDILLDFIRLTPEVQQKAITRGYPGLIEVLEWMTQIS